MKPPPRNRASRIEDTLRRLEQDIDAWVATSSPEGGPPGLVPLSFHWDGTDLLMATLSRSPAGRNLRATRLSRVALGGLRDVVMIDATVRELPMEQVSDERWSAFERRVKWDPRQRAGVRRLPLPAGARPALARVQRAGRPHPHA